MPASGRRIGTARRAGRGGARVWQTAAAVVALSALVLAALPSGAWGGTTATENSDKARVAALEQKMAADGATLQQMVNTYDQAQARASSIENALDTDKARVAGDEQTEQRALAVLRGAALDSYMTNSDDTAALSVFEMGNIMSLTARDEYSRLANASLHDDIDAVTVDEDKTEAAETTLRSEQTAADAALAQAAAAKDSAQTVLAQDDALLGQAKDSLAAIEAVIAREEEQQRLEEEGLYGSFGGHPLSISYDPTPGSYTNPLRAISDLQPERVDQGVDYSGYGPITAIGDGVVLSTYNSGWPGGTFIAYKLTDGPAGGLVVYAAEDIYPSVSVGQNVNAGTVLGTMYEGPDGIETGWSDPSGDGNTMARDAGQFNGSNSTAFGANFSQLLASLGAPPGVMQNEPPTGSLPPNWPQW